MEQRFERIVTEDGSHTYHDRLREITFRSTHGARTESRHVFVDGSGLRDGRDLPAVWTVLELGFGGARNFGESVLRARKLGVKLRYHAIERSPLPVDLVDHEDAEVTGLARRALGSTGVSVGTDAVELLVHELDWRDVARVDVAAVDAVYHDPFAPGDDPESWTAECFEWAARHADQRTVLATYSAASAVKDAMAEAGWWVAKAPGPGRKREVTFAARSPERLAEHDLVREPR